MASLFIGTGNKVEALVKNLDISALSTEVAGGFVGCTIGLYAMDTEERKEKVKANFKSFAYRRVVPRAASEEDKKEGIEE